MGEFEDRQRESMTDFNRSSYSIRDMLMDAVKRAQAEADIRRFELEEYLRANGFVRPSPEKPAADVVMVRLAVAPDAKGNERLDANRALYEVTGRRTAAGAEKPADYFPMPKDDPLGR